MELAWPTQRHSGTTQMRDRESGIEAISQCMMRCASGLHTGPVRGRVSRQHIDAVVEPQAQHVGVACCNVWQIAINLAYEALPSNTLVAGCMARSVATAKKRRNGLLNKRKGATPVRICNESSAGDWLDGCSATGLVGDFCMDGPSSKAVWEFRGRLGCQSRGWGRFFLPLK